LPKTLSRPEISKFRERLCEAATRIFDARGREGFSMRELAAAVDVSAMTPYRYYKDKDEILAAVRARAFNRFAEALENAYAAPGDFVEKSNAVGRAYMHFAFSEPSSYRLMFDLLQPDEKAYPDLVRAATRARATMTRHVEGLVSAGILAGDPKLIGHTFWAVLHGAIMLEFARQLRSDCDFDMIVRAASTALYASFDASLKS
jgi:AcrR family transcriptional regulator